MPPGRPVELTAIEPSESDGASARVADKSIEPSAWSARSPACASATFKCSRRSVSGHPVIAHDNDVRVVACGRVHQHAEKRVLKLEALDDKRPKRRRYRFIVASERLVEIADELVIHVVGHRAIEHDEVVILFEGHFRLRDDLVLKVHERLEKALFSDSVAPIRKSGPETASRVRPRRAVSSVGLHHRKIGKGHLAIRDGHFGCARPIEEKVSSVRRKIEHAEGEPDGLPFHRR